MRLFGIVVLCLSLFVAHGAAAPGEAWSAVIQGKVQKYLPLGVKPFACAPQKGQIFIDEYKDNTCGKGISTLYGNWASSARPACYMGVQHYISQATQTGKEWAKWSPTITMPGRWDVYVGWRASANRSNRTPYLVYSDQGTYQFYVNQWIPDEEYDGFRYAKLGTFYFMAREASARPQNGFVKCVNGAGHSEGIDAVAFRYVGPYLTATDSIDTITLDWQAVRDVTEYAVYRSATDSRASAVQIGIATDVSYSDTTAEPGAEYFYWIKAVNAAGKAFWSNSASGTRLTTP